MNESSSSVQLTLPSLRSLQEIIHNRIIQKKMEIHPSHNKAYLESLWTEIDGNIAMGISTNTYATATTIISCCQELTVHFGLTIMSNC